MGPMTVILLVSDTSIIQVHEQIHISLRSDLVKHYYE